MFMKCIPTGMFGSNCYIIADKSEGIIIDPGVSSEDISEVATNAGLRISYIILTHTHIDHICNMDAVRDQTGGKVLVHEADAAALSDHWFNGSALFGKPVTFRKPDAFVKDGDILTIGDMKIEIIHTPGHTPGGICIKAENSIFSGDTLFRRSIGRTDLGNGDYNQIISSIKNKLLTLDTSTKVYPGHGEATTIGYEREHNPFL